MSTYLELTNNVLARLNEEPLTSSTFASARGIYAAVKLGVRNAIGQINSQKFEWPFNYATDSQLLTIGLTLYDFPADYKIADWESFYIEADTIDDVENTTTRLEPIQRQEWYKNSRQRDFDNDTDGRDIPRKVFWYGSGQYGVTPCPDKAYVVHYNYWILTTALSLYSDSITIPENFNHVIEQGALEDMYVFLDNDQRAALSNTSFKNMIKDMAVILVPQDISDMRGTMINLGGGNHFGGYRRATDPFIF